MQERALTAGQSTQGGYVFLAFRRMIYDFILCFNAFCQNSKKP